MSNSIKKIKVIFVLPSLRAGGAERVMSFIASNLNTQEFDASLLVVGFKKDQAFDIQNLNVTYLNSQRVSRAVFKIAKHIRKEKPDIVISAIGHLNVIISFISLFFYRTKFVGRETNVKSIRKQHEKKRFKIKLNLHKYSLKYLDAVVCQSQDMLDDLIAHDNIDESKFVVINNPITDQFTLNIGQIDSETINYITVGALHPRKGHDRILKALSKLDHDFTYTVVGSGDKHLVFDIASQLNLIEKIHHIKYTKSVEVELAKHKVFLNGSYVEGFPNSILESCAVGTPVVAFNAPGGINEIIEHGVNGYVASSEKEFVNYLNAINISYPFKRQLVSESVTKKYNKNTIVSRYETFFKNLKFSRPLV
jgi:glycosyltransferase involved in cell wall biosynthesis